MNSKKIKNKAVGDGVATVGHIILISSTNNDNNKTYSEVFYNVKTLFYYNIMFVIK